MLASSTPRAGNRARHLLAAHFGSGMVNGFLYYAGGSMGYDMPEEDYEE